MNKKGLWHSIIPKTIHTMSSLTKDGLLRSSMHVSTFYEIKWQRTWFHFMMQKKELLHSSYVGEFMFDLFRNPSFDPRLIRDMNTTTLMMDAISRNPNITEKIVKNNSNLNWQYDLLFAFSKIPVETMLSMFANIVFDITYPSVVILKQRCIVTIQKHANLTLSIVLAHADFTWDWHFLSKHKNISMNEIRKHYRLPWDWATMSENPNLTTEMVLTNSNKNWNWQILSTRSFAFDLLLQFSLDKFDIDALCENPAITIEQIKRYEYRHWNWYNISKNPAITMKDIVKTPYMLWNWKGIAENPNLTIQMVLSNADKFASFMWGVTRNPAITKQNILDNPQMGWSFSYGCYSSPSDNPLSSRATMYKGYTLDELHKKWLVEHARYLNGITRFAKYSADNCKNISMNDLAKYSFVVDFATYEFRNRCEIDTEITMKMIEQHPEMKWDWTHIVKNPFTVERENYVASHVKPLIIAIVLEFHEENYATSNVENVFADNHLVWCVIKY